MAVLRVIGWLLLLSGIAALGFDVWIGFSQGGEVPLAMGELWQHLLPNSFSFFHSLIIDHNVWAPLADGIGTLLAFPAWIVLGLPGVLLLLITGFRRKKPKRIFS